MVVKPPAQIFIPYHVSLFLLSHIAMATKPQGKRVRDNHTKEKLSERQVTGINWHMHTAHTHVWKYTLHSQLVITSKSCSGQSLSCSAEEIDWLWKCQWSIIKWVKDWCQEHQHLVTGGNLTFLFFILYLLYNQSHQLLIYICVPPSAIRSQEHATSPVLFVRVLSFFPKKYKHIFANSMFFVYTLQKSPKYHGTIKS